MFLEVKKDNDQVSAEQLQCLAQIRALLNSEVGIVRVVSVGSRFPSRRYELDLDAHTGKPVDG